MTNDESKIRPAIVTEATQAKQAGEIRSRWGWIEHSAWTDRMLTRLEQSEPTTVWFGLWDKVCARRNLQAAFWAVWRNDGAPGVDGQTVRQFDAQSEAELARLGAELRAQRYRRQPARRVWIPKPGTTEKRPLGIPTVADRVAQMVVKRHLEPRLERLFHADSYGYRPFKSAQDAVGRARQRCWRYDWVLDLDIKGFFDNIPHDWMMRAVRKHAAEKWVVLYIERWLQAPAQDEQGQQTPRDKGTPQGGVISPLLANLFLHYALDQWMARQNPNIPFERYADDAILHCRTREEAERLREAIIVRLAACGLELNLQKTKIVYCKDDDRRGNHEHEKFTFLGYEFRPRRAKNYRGKYFISFLPAVSDKAAKKIRQEMRGWKLHLRSDKTLSDLARMFNPIIRGWVQYYGRYYRSMLHPIFRPLDRTLVRWACRKYKKLRGHHRRAAHWLRRISVREPRLWAHWEIGVRGQVL